VEERGIKENSGGGKFKYDIFDILLRTIVNATMYPHPAKYFLNKLKNRKMKSNELFSEKTLPHITVKIKNQAKSDIDGSRNETTFYI
jgi:predicted nucleotidyltransferase